MGGILLIFHLLNIYYINGLIFAIEEELIATIKSKFNKSKRKSTDDFYQNYTILNSKFPDYSPFFV